MKMTIVRKMILLVAFAILGMVGQVWLGQNRMNAVYEKTNFANVNSVPAIVDLYKANALFGHLRVRPYRHVLATDMAEMAKIETTIKVGREDVLNALKEYESTIVDDKDKHLTEEDYAAFNAYFDGLDKALELSRQNKKEQARDLLVQTRPLDQRAYAAFDAHLEYNIELAKKGSGEAIAAKNHANLMSTIIVVIDLLATALLGWFITHNLKRQLGGEPDAAAYIANKIAAGDLSSKIEIKSGDTISLFYSMKTMQDNLSMIVEEIKSIVGAANKGDFSVKIDLSGKAGYSKELSELLNQLSDTVDTAFGDTIRVAKALAQGDLSQKVTRDYQGAFNEVKQSVNTTADSLTGIVAEIKSIVAAANKGDFSAKMNLNGKAGYTKELSELLNQLSDTVDTAFGDTIRVAKALAQGDLSQKVTRDYQGAYNEVKQSVNTTADSLTGIVAEIKGIVAAANKGDFSAKMNLNGKAGYTKELAELLNQLSDTVDTAFKDTIHVAQALEQGDLTRTVTRDYQGAFDQVKQSLNNTVAKLSQVISEVNSAAANIAGASEEVSSTAQSMSQATSEQAASVEETSASVEQMGASINQNTENAKVTDAMAAQASSEAAQGGDAVKKTVSAMKSIAGKIGIIDDIAYQTNLLALNAAIEAARAGEHGKGFAVVAAEVRKLAERSQVAAQEIGELASGSVEMAESAGKLLDTIVPSIKKTSDLVQEIAAASEEQSAGAGQINTAMDQLNRITQQNASSSEQLAATSEEMSGQAAQLQELMAFFTVDMASGAASAVSKTRAFKPAGQRAVAAKHAPHDAEFVKF
ncbi:MAG: methyl-accepting chemotaxis protein [Methylobacter sp.]|nr:MAG: methyl-accepting chemotaxis protein [Methylobacter sp.]